MPSDQELISGCLANQRTAQRLLFDRYSGTLYGLALRYVKRPEIAQDISAEAWIKIFANLESFTGKGNFEGWLKRITVNEALMYLRKNRLQTTELDELSERATELNFKVQAVRKLEYADVLDLLDQLPDGCRTVYNLYELEGYKHREIAEKLGISINTCKSQLILAKKKLRAAYLQLAEREGTHLRPIPKVTKKRS